MAGKGAVTLARWRELPPAKFSPHARPGAAPREPGPMETLASHVSSEPGRGGLFARAGPGWGGGPGNQTSAGCITLAWLTHMQESKHTLMHHALAIIKNKFRNKMGDSLMDDCLVICIRRDILL